MYIHIYLCICVVFALHTVVLGTIQSFRGAEAPIAIVRKDAMDVSVCLQILFKILFLGFSNKLK